MNNYVYIITDSNRRCLHVGMTDNLYNATNTYQELTELFFEDSSKVTRLVYHEGHPSAEMALSRFTELSTYTRMQKEKLIRRSNPNWVSLMPSSPLKAIARREYASF